MIIFLINLFKPIPIHDEYFNYVTHTHFKIFLTLIASISLHTVILFMTWPFKSTVTNTPKFIHAYFNQYDQTEKHDEQTGQLNKHKNKINQQATAKKQPAIKSSPIKPLPKKIKSAPTTKPKSVLLHTQTKHIKKTIKPEKQKKTRIKEQKNVSLSSNQAIKSTAQSSTPQRAIIKTAYKKTHDENADPTYTDYTKLLINYLSQYIEAPSKYKGTLRLKILIAYKRLPIAVEIIQSSGDIQLDNWAKIKAISAGPYPDVPESIGTTFEFSPTLIFGSQ
jgi:hypothetical protein